MNLHTLQPARRTARRRGFTLLEVLLALGLSVLLLAAVAMAVDFHLRVLETGRAEVEQAQLARAILRRIADDLRGALQYTPSATSSSSSTSSTTGSSDSSTSSTSTSTTDSSSTSDSSDESTLEDQQTTDRTSNLANATSLPALPGIYGNNHELQIDVSRLPRLDQMQAVLSSEATTGSTTGTAGAPAGWSDLRTVLYFMENSASASVGPPGAASGGGLLRRDVDRTTAALALEQGDGVQNQGPEEPMAPEVQEIQFRYFDGTEWVETWDTTDRSGLPLAVYVGIALACPPKSRRMMGIWGGGADEMNQDRRTYQLLVHLPAARATTSASASGADSTSSSSSTNSTTTSGSGGTATTTPQQQ